MEIFVYLDSMYNLMYDFFINESDGGIVPFKLFGLVHIALFIITIFGMILVFKNRLKLYQINEKLKRKISIFIVVFMALNMIIYYLSKVYFGVYNWKVHLPLHLCFISGILFMIAIATKNRRLYKITYFMAFIGPLPAIIWPELYKTFDSFIFYHYIISHHFFLIANMFIYCSYDVDINKDDIVNTFLFVNIVFIVMIIFNNIFGTNYIMSSSLPQYMIDLYPILEYINYPAIFLEIIGILIVTLAYIPVWYNNKLNGD